MAYSFVYNPITGLLDMVGISSSAWVTPEQFGAKGDGVADDTAAVKSADAAAVASNSSLLISENYLLTSNVTLASAVFAINGGMFKKSGNTLTINGAFSAGWYQVFSGFNTGDVTFGSGSVNEVFPEWWATTDGYFDAQIQKAVASITKGIVRFVSNSYQLNTGLTFNNLTDISSLGSGYNATSFVVNGNSQLSFTGVCSRLAMKDMWIGSFFSRASGYGISFTGTSGTHSDHIQLENL